MIAVLQLLAHVAAVALALSMWGALAIIVTYVVYVVNTVS